MILYYFLIFFLLIEAAVIFVDGSSNEKKKIFSTLAFVELFIISAFRSSNIGNDTKTYLQLFQQFGLSGNVFNDISRFESGYILLNKIVYFFSENSQSILIVTSFIILFLYLRFIYKESEMVWLSMFLFITLRDFYGTMNTLRLCLAIGIILVSYKYLKEKKLIPFILSVTVASLFHSTAIIFFIAYPISHLKFNLRNFFAMGLAGGIAFVAFNPLIALVVQVLPQYQHYLEASQYFGTQLLANYAQFFIDLSILFFGITIITLSTNRKRDLVAEDQVNEKQSVSEIDILLNLMLVGTIISLIAVRASLLDRVASYFSVFSIIFIPKVIMMVENKNERTMYIYIIMILTLIYHTVIFVYRPEWNSVFPYEFFWQE